MSRVRANLLLVITAFVWGFAFVAQKSGMEGLGPTWFTGFRFVLGALCIFPLCIYERRRHHARGGERQMHTRGKLNATVCGVFLFLVLFI